MRFYPPDAPVPDALRTDAVLLRMLRATDNPLDHDAVMASQTQLLTRTAGRWPVAGFSSAENLKDLQEHEADHHARTSFTYTVMRPDEAQCLGCVYINPLGPWLQSMGADEATLARVPADAAVVDFWVRSERLADDLDRHVLAALLRWFREAWSFALVTHLATDAEPRHLAILADAGLTLWHQYPRSSGGHGHLYTDNTAHP